MEFYYYFMQQIYLIMVCLSAGKSAIYSWNLKWFETSATANLLRIYDPSWVLLLLSRESKISEDNKNITIIKLKQQIGLMSTVGRNPNSETWISPSEAQSMQVCVSAEPQGRAKLHSG